MEDQAAGTGADDVPQGGLHWDGDTSQAAAGLGSSEEGGEEGLASDSTQYRAASCLLRLPSGAFSHTFIPRCPKYFNDLPSTCVSGSCKRAYSIYACAF